jgi:hypothetical protein
VNFLAKNSLVDCNLLGKSSVFYSFCLLPFDISTYYYGATNFSKDYFYIQNSVDSIPKLCEKLPSLRNELRDERESFL